MPGLAQGSEKLGKRGFPNSNIGENVSQVEIGHFLIARAGIFLARGRASGNGEG